MEYEVIRSHRRTMALEVRKDGSVVVRAPHFADSGTVARFVKSHEEWIAKKQEKMMRRTQTHPEPTPQQVKHYRRMAQELLPVRLEYWSEIIGVQPAALHITSARTRFGSCSAKNSISFSWRLMQYSPETIDYVVVHELCHILHHDHSAAFWAEVSRYLPDYKERQKQLKTE